MEYHNHKVCQLLQKTVAGSFDKLKMDATLVFLAADGYPFKF